MTGSSAKREKVISFTFIELLVAMVIVTVLLFAAFGTFQIAIGRYDLQTSYGDAMQTVNAAKQQIGIDARNAVTYTKTTVSGNPVYEFTLPVDCQTNATYCATGVVSPSNIDQVNANGTYLPEQIGGQTIYVLGPQVAYYLSDITGSQSVTGGTILWRATAPTGTSSFTPDTAWSLVNTTVPRCSGITSFTMSTNGLPSGAVALDMTVSETSNHTSYSYSVASLQMCMANYN